MGLFEMSTDVAAQPHELTLPPMPEPLQVIDSHTEGEPTRVVVSGFPTLEGSTMMNRREDFRARFDYLRTGLIKEPRGHDAIVGALLTPPVSEGADAGVIYFNDAGYLGMCGHGTIGVAETLRYLGRAPKSLLRLDTPVGTVTAEFGPDGAITITNIASRTIGKVAVPGAFARPEGGEGQLSGEVAYGGNWFFLMEVPLAWLNLEDNLDFLMSYTKSIRAALETAGITGDDGGLIDHVELYAPTPTGAKNFVLCPGNAYDRSPCGTGTSAKLACMQAAGHLAPGQSVEIESIAGGKFQARYSLDAGKVIPHITGRAYVTGLMQPVFEPQDPFCWGIGSTPLPS
jgi:proline racemase